MTTKFHRVGCSWWCVSSLLLSLTACPALSFSDDDKDDGGTANPKDDKVEQNKDAADLTNDEAMRVCESIMSVQTPEQQCTAAAVHGSMNPADCERFRGFCLQHASGDPAKDRCKGDEVAMSLGNCVNVSIGEIKDCFAKQLELDSKLTCANAGTPIAPPPCVQQLAQRCPGVFEEGRPVGSGPTWPSDFDGGTQDPFEPMGQGGQGGGFGGQGPGQQPGPGVDPESCSTAQASDANASSVDCAAFCAGLTGAECSQAPDQNQCLLGCTAAKAECPGTLNNLVGCSTQPGKAWACTDDGKPSVPGCGMQLGCFGMCVGALAPPPPPPPSPQP